jgi:rfaE bifunctional protein kinase chain/domain
MVKQLGWSGERLEKIVSAWRGKKILVIGDVGVDRYTIGSVERISPEAPVPIVRVEEEKLKLGLAANVADNIQALGGVPLMTGVIGKDRAGEDFRQLMSKAKISSQYLVSDTRARTIVKERIVSDLQQLLRVDYENDCALGSKTEAMLLKTILKGIKECDAVVLEDYAKGLLNPRLVQAIFLAAKKAGKQVAVDPNSRTAVETYRGAAILTPNTREAEALSGEAIRDQAALIRAGRKILKATLASHVVITRGREGMAVFTAGQTEVQVIPTYAQEVYDVSGAGDTVIAVLALAITAGAKIEEAAVLGNLAAGVEVGKRGTATVSPAEIRAAIARHGK